MSRRISALMRLDLYIADSTSPNRLKLMETVSLGISRDIVRASYRKQCELYHILPIMRSASRNPLNYKD